MVLLLIAFGGFADPGFQSYGHASAGIGGVLPAGIVGLLLTGRL